MKRISKALVLLIFSNSLFSQTEYHVSIDGNDAYNGSITKPFKTISAAANIALPGDVVTVRHGIYREAVNPPRGGTSETNRITYQAAPGEKVTITGSEQIKNWVNVVGDTWKVSLPNSYFGNFNPYSDRIRGDWFWALKNHIDHTGNVYMNGDWIQEAQKLDELIQPEGKAPLWYAIVDGAKGENLLNISWFKPTKTNKIFAAEPSLRYGSQPIKCSEGGECTGNIQSGDYLRFDAVDFGTRAESIEFRAASGNVDGSLIEIRLGKVDGELIGTCNINNTGDWQKWQNFVTNIKPTSGEQTVFLVFIHPKYKEGSTTIYARFPNVNPNKENVEISKRETVFYPSKNFINYITVRGFTLKNASPNWAPPSSEQKAIIGTNWSKGWIIENNEISYSKCSGVSLGKYGDGTDNTNEKEAADPYTACVKRALKNGWNKETIGSHIVRNNHIHHCEQTGIVGSMGCAFSKIYGNEIHEIHVLNLFNGAEMAGIKLHGAVDVEIHNNHIYRCGNLGGLWLDWMAQGAIVTNNLFHDNTGGTGDVYFEMLHGPVVFANNILLTKHKSFDMNSKGIAFVHNLITSKYIYVDLDERNTPFHKAHSTEIAGLFNAPSGDHRFYNNIFTAPFTMKGVNNSRLECFALGNVYLNGATASKYDKDSLVQVNFNPEISLTEKNGEWFLKINVEKDWVKNNNQKLVTSSLLGKAKIPQQNYENTDGTALKVDTDYFNKKRNTKTPFPGPIEFKKSGRQEIKVWPNN